MFDAVMKPDIFTGDRMLVWLSFLLTSTIILAENGKQFELPTMYDAIISEEIYKSAGGWRESSPTENDWRASPKKNNEGRIKFSDDPAHLYKQGTTQQDDQIPIKQKRTRKTRTTEDNLFRLEF